MKSESQFESLAESAFNVDKLTLAVSDSQRALDFEKTAQYDKAISLLQNASKTISNLIDSAPRDRIPMLSLLVKNFKNRIKQIRKEKEEGLVLLTSGDLNLLSQQEENYGVDGLRSAFRPPPPLMKKFKYPTNPYLKVFFNLRLFSESYRRGGYITPTLYVHKNVWRRKGAKINKLEEKQKIFSKLKSSFKTLHIIKKQDGFNRPEKKEVDDLIDELRNKYLRELEEVSPLLGRLHKHQRKEKDTIRGKISEQLQNFGNLMNTIIVNQVIEKYTAMLDQFFNECQFVGEWLEELEEKKENMNKRDKESKLKERLELIAQFLSDSVVPTVLQDIHQMMKNYIDTESEKAVDGKKKAW